MRGSAIAASLALSLMALSAGPVFAQTPAQAKPAPATPAPAQTPPAPAPAQPPAPFPMGAKVAFFNPQAVFQASADGKAAVTRVNALIQKKQTENADKAKLLQGNQQKLQTSGSVMNEAARVQLEKEIEKQTKDAERFQQDAQAEINELQQEVQTSRRGCTSCSTSRKPASRGRRPAWISPATSSRSWMRRRNRRRRPSRSHREGHRA